MLVDFIVRKVMGLQHIYFLGDLLGHLFNGLFVRPSSDGIFVYPLMEEADTFRLSILICRRVKTAVT